ncbi:DUF3237 domain-containing protein [Microbacterium sp. TPD7012]|uniref:DUF3237 domain-containing protein n=1 Tax=Microbacterium sp. TPD7012 TaxID=2171975 RepID=UPI000D508C10|nr:DUF3237 domain-containing protein [Microbacterium sp. TPD7012]PVE98709.1 DUF3237 domain-containing protein [Microbacterium sp. TPD7012]
MTSTEPMTPSLEYCFELQVDVAPPQRIGRGEGGGLHFTPITGGRIVGPRAEGRVLPGGGDWWVDHGVTTQLDARYLIEIDGHVVDVVNRGYWRANADAIERFEAGGIPREEDLYYRTAFVFQTDAVDLRWLAESQFIGYARPGEDQVVIRVFRVV